MQNVLDTLRERGFLAQITFEDELLYERGFGLEIWGD